MIGITNASVLDDYKIKVVFTTGEEGIADLSELVTEGVFQKIKDQDRFRNFSVDDTIVWKDEVEELDIAPEYIYFQVFKEKPDLQNLFEEWGYRK